MSVKIFEGNYNGEGYKFAIVASRFNDFIVKSLVSGAVDALRRHGVKDDDIEVYKVPGAFEIPFLCKKLALTDKFDCNS